MKFDQESVDWHIVHEAVSDAINNAEGTPGAKDLQSAFAKHGLLVMHEEDTDLLPDREAFWLIERTVQPPQYITEGDDLTSDAWRARRFRSEREAHDHWRLLRSWRDECKVIAHVFINKSQ